MTVISTDGWTLVDTATGKPVSIGDKRPCHNEDAPVTIEGGRPPRKAFISGLVYIRIEDGLWSDDCYPSVVGCHWVSDVGGVAGLPTVNGPDR